MSREIRDYVTVEDEHGIIKQFAIEALFDMEEDTFAFLISKEDDNDVVIMQVEDDESGQYLIGIEDSDKKQMVLDAYEIAVQANPAE